MRQPVPPQPVPPNRYKSFKFGFKQKKTNCEIWKKGRKLVRKCPECNYWVKKKNRFKNHYDTKHGGSSSNSSSEVVGS